MTPPSLDQMLRVMWTPHRLKALRTEASNTLAELVNMRAFFRKEFREMTQETLERWIDIWLTVHGIEDRLGVVSEVRG